MKKLFILLLSIWIPVYLLIGLLASCKKSSMDESAVVKTQSSSPVDTAKNVVAGRWQLSEFFQDNGNGQGSWISAQDPEQVSFTASGDFSANQYFTLYNRQFNKYRFVDSIHIELFSTQSEEAATFYYRRENTTSLLFHPVCKENCARRYKLIN